MDCINRDPHSRAVRDCDYERWIVIESLELVKKATEALESKKGEDVVVLDVTSLSSVTGYFVIATGNNAPQIKAMVQAVESELKQEGLRCYRVGGSPESEWMVMDYLDAVVHVFSPRAREYYAIEQLWSDAPRLEVSG